MANWNNRVLYVGSTAHFPGRIAQHKEKLVPSFTRKYNINKLVYYDVGDNLVSVREREWQIKRWRREKKNSLVESMNPAWNDLYPALIKSLEK